MIGTAPTSPTIALPTEVMGWGAIQFCRLLCKIVSQILNATDCNADIAQQLPANMSISVGCFQVQKTDINHQSLQASHSASSCSIWAFVEALACRISSIAALSALICSCKRACSAVGLVGPCASSASKLAKRPRNSSRCSWAWHV